MEQRDDSRILEHLQISGHQESDGWWRICKGWSGLAWQRVFRCRKASFC